MIDQTAQLKELANGKARNRYDVHRTCRRIKHPIRNLEGAALWLPDQEITDTVVLMVADHQDRPPDQRVERIGDHGFECVKPGTMARLGRGRRTLGSRRNLGRDCKLNDVDPLAYPPTFLSRIVNGMQTATSNRAPRPRTVGFLTRLGSLSVNELCCTAGTNLSYYSMSQLITRGHDTPMKSVVNPLRVSRFLQKYDAAAAEKGVKLSIGFDFHEYISITAATPTKGPTYPNFRPDRSPIKSGDGFWIVGVDKNNDVALLEAARLYNISHSNLAEHLQSLKAFFADPNLHAHPQDRCTCIAPSAQKITGKVAYLGDRWVRRDLRGQGMSKIMAGIARGVSFAMWAPDFLVALVARRLLEKGVVYGYSRHEPGGSILQLIEENIVDDDCLVWQTGAELKSLVDGGSELVLTS